MTRHARVAAALALLTACSSRTPRAIEDARKAPGPGDGATTSDAARATAVDAATAPATAGDLAVRVEWVDVPPAARSPGARTACGTPRAPAVAPTTTWGIPDAIVVVDVLDRDPGPARVRIDGCAVAPVVAVASTLVVESVLDRPAIVALRDAAAIADLRTPGASGATRTLRLPIAGHAVESALERGRAYELTAAASTAAWIVAGPGAVTDASGVATIRDLPPATYTVRAWLPPRGGQGARHARGEITVKPGELAELTLALVP